MIRIGKELPVVLQIKVTPDAKSVTEKFNLNLAKSPTCEHGEYAYAYACTCAHDSEGKAMRATSIDPAFQARRGDNKVDAPQF
jgi:hypothetical protein